VQLVEPALQHGRSPEVYQSLRNYRRQHEALKQKSLILLRHYSKQQGQQAGPQKQGKRSSTSAHTKDTTKIS